METTAAKSTYVGLFLTAMATLAYELVLTRIFSVTVWYHFGFLAVSLAMLGMTAGALAIYIFPSLFPENETKRQLSIFATLLAVSAPIAYLSHACMPIILLPTFVFAAVGMFAVLSNCLLLSVPFVFSGICVCLALTRFPKQVAKLYAADLLGAAAACVLVVYQLSVSDGPSTLLVSAVLAALAGICFSLERQKSIEMKYALACFLVLGIVTSANISQFRSGQNSFFRLVWIKGTPAPRPIYEKWNSFSAVRVLGNPDKPAWPTGWGLNPAFVKGPVTGQIYEDIDGNAATCLTGFRGNLSEVDYLKSDVTNVAQHLIDDAKVLVIGVGGGRDVLSALVFKQHDVLGVELNDHILEALTKEFGGFTGHLDQLPNVRLVNDEARSFVSRSKEKFDFIQISLVDTWAATSAGAFALAENALYTREGWDTFLEHLSDRGILSVSRWYSERNPAEIYRIVSLAGNSLKTLGVQDTRPHLVLVKYDPPQNSPTPGVGTMIVSRSPFTAEQLTRLKETCDRLHFRIMLAPGSALDSNLALLADQKLSPRELQSKFTSAITPPTDDCPYFFQMAKAPDLSNLPLWFQTFRDNTEHMQGLVILGFLSVSLTVLLTLCVFLPLSLKSSAGQLSGSKALCTYFLAIGMGFMFIEISQMQRLAIFLGNPSYGLAVVLFTMLTFTGLGSMMLDFLDKRKLISPSALPAVAISVVVLIIGLITPSLLKHYMSADNPTRIIVSICLLAPLGLFAGTAFPTGMKMASGRSQDLTAWLWGINGAASVLASVLAVLASIGFGITASYYVSLLWYALAAWSAVVANRTRNEAVIITLPAE